MARDASEPGASEPEASEPEASDVSEPSEPAVAHGSADAGPRADGGLREVLLVYGVAFLGTMALGAVRTGTVVDDLAQVGIALLFLGIPLHLARREKNGARRYGIDLSGLLEPLEESEPAEAGPLGLYDLFRALRRALPEGLREFGFALGLAAIVFPPFVVGFWIWHQPPHGYLFRLPPDLASFALAQFVLVGLPEEAFFRGFVHTRLHDYAGTKPDSIWTPRLVLGVPLSIPAWILGSALFALVHLASEPRLDELATFFPGLLFGWLRAKRGGIGAALSFHALSNLIAELLVRGWLT